MRFLSKFFVAAVGLMLFLPTLMAVAVQNPPVDNRVLKVGSLVIKQSDINIRAQKIMPMQVSFHGTITADKIAEIKLEALDELVDRAYKVQYAIDEEISIEAASIESEWQKRLDKNPQAAANAKASQLSKAKAELYLDMLASKAEKLAVDEKITVSDDAVATYYKKNEEKYFRPKLYTASHVFVRVDPASNTEEKAVMLARAEELFARAKAGEDFYDLAYYESDDRSKYVGGSLGSFHAGQTVPAFDAAIQAMKPGDVAGPVRSMYGFHIIRLDDLADERQLSFDEVSAKIRAELETAEREKLYEGWMAKLKEKYPLERFDQQVVN